MSGSSILDPLHFVLIYFKGKLSFYMVREPKRVGGGGGLFDTVKNEGFRHFLIFRSPCQHF